MYHLNSIIPNTGNQPSLWTREVRSTRFAYFGVYALGGSEDRRGAVALPGVHVASFALEVADPVAVVVACGDKQRLGRRLEVGLVGRVCVGGGAPSVVVWRLTGAGAVMVGGAVVVVDHR